MKYQVRITLNRHFHKWFTLTDDDYKALQDSIIQELSSQSIVKVYFSDKPSDSTAHSLDDITAWVKACEQSWQQQLDSFGETFNPKTNLYHQCFDDLIEFFKQKHACDCHSRIKGLRYVIEFVGVSEVPFDPKIRSHLEFIDDKGQFSWQAFIDWLLTDRGYQPILRYLDSKNAIQTKDLYAIAMNRGIRYLFFYLDSLTYRFLKVEGLFKRAGITSQFVDNQLRIFTTDEQWFYDDWLNVMQRYVVEVNDFPPTDTYEYQEQQQVISQYDEHYKNSPNYYGFKSHFLTTYDLPDNSLDDLTGFIFDGEFEVELWLKAYQK